MYFQTWNNIISTHRSIIILQQTILNLKDKKKKPILSSKKDIPTDDEIIEINCEYSDEDNINGTDFSGY
jgi:hypothetical protein